MFNSYVCLPEGIKIANISPSLGAVYRYRYTLVMLELWISLREAIRIWSRSFPPWWMRLPPSTRRTIALRSDLEVEVKLDGTGTW
jgi:hypothetical protein